MRMFGSTGKNHLSPLRVLAVAWFFISLILMSTHGTALAQEQALENLKETGKTFAAVAKKASPSVVFIKVEKSVTQQRTPMQLPFNDDFFKRFFGEPMPGPQFQNPNQQKRMVRGQGSGFIISSDGYILTNNHVVGEADKVMVKLLDGREYTAKIVGTDPPTDVAVVKIDAKDLSVLALGDSDKIDVGEWVLALGNPFGLSHTLTAGIVSAKGRNHVGISDYEDFIQTDAAINPGNSGGPLIDLEGRVVGINTAIFSQNGGYMGIGFAIPIAMARSIYTQLIDHGNVDRGYIGVKIQDLTPELAASFKLRDAKGVLVAQVMPNTPAEKAGLQQGDVIVRLNGETLDTVAPFRNKVAMMAPGTRLDLVVLRDGKEKKISLITEKLTPEAAQKTSQPEKAEKLGLTVVPLTKELADKYGYKDEKGVLVTQVDQGSEASRAGIKPGMLIAEVDRKAVSGLKDFEQAMEKPGDRPILFLVKDPQGSHFIAVERKK